VEYENKKKLRIEKMKMKEGGRICIRMSMKKCVAQGSVDEV
jgi:hypothetical protein